MRRGLALLALAFTTAACGSASTSSGLPQYTLAKRSVVCGRAKPWTSAGKLVHAHRVGNLVWMDVPSFEAGRPTKVTIEAVAGAPNARIRLFGTRCADGTPLRFGFFTGGGGGNLTPARIVAKSGLAGGGAGYLPLAVGQMRRQGWKEIGFVTLTRGKWILQARSGWTDTLASVVFDVR